MKKIFIIWIFVLTILISSHSSDAVVCCEKLAGSGDYCVEVNSKSSCDSRGEAFDGLRCDNAPSCQIGCCVFEGGGSCRDGQTRAICDVNGGSWTVSGCGEVDVCKKGCCFVGSNTFFGSEGECIADSRDKGLDYEFELGFDNGSQCQARLDILTGNEEKGCCVALDGGCSYGTRGQCDTSQNSFADGYCMDINICKCEDWYSCNGKKDVYQMSSCGDERIQEECDGVLKSCNLVRTHTGDNVVLDRGKGFVWEEGLGAEHVAGATGDLRGIACVSNSCEEGSRFVFDKSKRSLFRVDESQQVITIDREMLGSSFTGSVSVRKHGESWCKGPVENDEPGSRHYVYRCIEGKIEPEPCDPSRNANGICKETRENGFSDAGCIDNDWTTKKALKKEVAHPPALQFYTQAKQPLSSLGLADSCGACNAQDSFLNPFDQCKEDMCTALGDCGFDKDGFGLRGCLTGAAIAEAIWLGVGTIATLGESSAGIAEGTAFENTGFGGFFDSGFLSDIGNNMQKNNVVRKLGDEGFKLQENQADVLLDKGEWIIGDKNTVYKRTAAGEFTDTLAGEVNSGLLEELGVTSEEFVDISTNKIQNLPRPEASVLSKVGDVAKDVAEKTAMAKGLEKGYTELFSSDAEDFDSYLGDSSGSGVSTTDSPGGPGVVKTSMGSKPKENVASVVGDDE